ncbi:hypothetical protein [Alsobacter sp. R-9]
MTRFYRFGFWFLVGFLVVDKAMAHSWYPAECCSSSDCEMISASQLRRDETGWILPSGETVPFAAARDSLDHQFHWCRYGGNGSLIRPSGKAPCLFVPPGGV